VFSSIRTVVAFGGEKREVKRYKKKLKEAFNAGVSKVGLNPSSFNETL